MKEMLFKRKPSPNGSINTLKRFDFESFVVSPERDKNKI